MLKKPLNKSTGKNWENEDTMDATVANLGTVASVETGKGISGKTQEGNALEKQNERLNLLEGFEPFNGSQNLKSSHSVGLSIVYAPTGKRITLSRAILSHLPSDVKSIQIAFSKEYLLIGECLDENYTNYQLRNLGKNKVIYSSSLIKDIVDRYQLDYSTRSSMTFPIEKVEEIASSKFFFFDMTNKKLTKEGAKN